jgi:hypothetical protein
VRFAVIGDTGSGTEKQRDVGDMMVRYHTLFPYEFVLMMGDNMYGGEAPQDFEKKFAEPYRALLDQKVKFYATLEITTRRCKSTTPYSSAKKHGSDGQLREVVEPIFLKYGVDVVLTGHDHVYERIKPQKGIYYFVSGAGGKLRTGDIDARSGMTEKSYDRDLHFMLFEVAGDELYFQAISRTGETIDSGVIKRK